MTTYIVVGGLLLLIFTVWLVTYNVHRRLYMSDPTPEPDVEPSHPDTTPDTPDDTPDDE